MFSFKHRTVYYTKTSVLKPMTCTRSVKTAIAVLTDRVQREVESEYFALFALRTQKAQLQFMGKGGKLTAKIIL